jgi:flagella basal body P-ring formation protein FlgA
MLRARLFAACACLLVLPPCPAGAATLRAFRTLSGATVRLSDLFGDLAAPDRVLGAAPAPGTRILVKAPQLAAIARDFGVDWRPVSGAEQTIIERDSTAYPRSALEALLRAPLTSAGAPPDAGISLPDYAPPMLPAGATPHATLADFNYDPASYRFSALLMVSVPDTEPVALRLAGEVVPMVDVAMLTHHLQAGSVLSAQDVNAGRVPAVSLRGEPALNPTAAIGLALRRDMPPGRPLVMGDLVHPVLIARNATVRMALTAGAIALSAEGTALEDGVMGAHIRVLNPSSHAVILAEVTGADEVRIMPGHTPTVVAAQ